MMLHLLGSTWHIWRGRLRATWGVWSGNDLLVHAGRQEALRGKVQRRYGRRQPRIEERLDAYERRRALHREQWRAHRAREASARRRWSGVHHTPSAHTI